MTSIDIAIPCYNYGTYLKSAVESVLAQAIPDIRILILDNASTDGSAGIAHGMAAADHRISVVVNAENRGYHHSYNRAIDWAASKYFVLLDADDMLAPGSLKHALAALEASAGASFVHGIEARLHGNRLALPPARGLKPAVSLTRGQDFIRDSCTSPFCDVGAPTVMRRTAAQKQAGYFDVRLARASDMELYWRLARCGDVVRIDRVQAIRRVHGAQISVGSRTAPVVDLAENLAAYEVFFAGAGAELKDASRLRGKARQKVFEHAYWSAVAQLARGHLDGARATYAFAAAHRGHRALLPPLGFLFQKRYRERLAELALARTASARIPLDQWLAAARAEPCGLPT